ncbi:hypothetical protein HAZT_HAZT010061 [Hyalella azteca]|uniref:Uncharacterized protein n=1 Tax=Hyalella azteca TaxID=294128 RepID=A0A6A0GYX8_HYAAZ|nr:hypothetical protein HAZT_HAZT010061 [Hyalella azteca]
MNGLRAFSFKIERPFLEAVRLTLGDRYTDNMDQIYQLTIKFVLETVVKGYEMAVEREVNENVQQLDLSSEPAMNNGSDVPAQTTSAQNGANSAESSAVRAQGDAAPATAGGGKCPAVCPYVSSGSLSPTTS